MGYCQTGVSDEARRNRQAAEKKRGYNIRKVREAEVNKNAAYLTSCQDTFSHGELKVIKGFNALTVQWWGEVVYQSIYWKIKIARYNCDWTNALAVQAAKMQRHRAAERRKVAAYHRKTEKIDARYG
jgi:hypothetical protein